MRQGKAVYLMALASGFNCFITDGPYNTELVAYSKFQRPHQEHPEVTPSKIFTLAMGKRGSAGSIPVFNVTKDQPLDWNAIRDIYEKTQIIHVRNATAMMKNDRKKLFDYEDLCRLQTKKKQMIAETFCVENAAPGAKKLEADQVFGGVKKRPSASWYSSFLVQHDPDALKDTLKKLPFECPPLLESQDVSHSDHIWFFAGDNPKRKAMPGRPEHTDAVTHAGTWHYQLSGSKVSIVVNYKSVSR